MDYKGDNNKNNNEDNNEDNKITDIFNNVLDYRDRQITKTASLKYTKKRIFES